MTLNKLRKIAAQVQKAAAILVPLAADGKGADSHGGKIDVAKVEEAVEAIRTANNLIDQ